MSVTVILPVFNEELHLLQSLRSVVGWADRVVVVDSFSKDRTQEIARSFASSGVELVEHAYDGPADQKNWALDNLALDTDWVLFLDADECVTPELAGEIQAVCSDPGNPVAGYFINRRIIWFGRWIRHGGWFPNWNLRLFRTGRARYEQRRVHEHMIVDGPSAKLEGHLVHEDLRDLTHSIAKHNRYSNLEAEEYERVLDGTADTYGKLLSRDPLARRRWLKTRVFARLPCKPLIYFAWAYCFKLGFLDGRLGLRYHALHATFKAFDEAKLWERRRNAAKGEPTYWARYLASREPRETTYGVDASRGVPDAATCDALQEAPSIAPLKADQVQAVGTTERHA
jgi:glycosyltransferase involved in cell wall biosynthesis